MYMIVCYKQYLSTHVCLYILYQYSNYGMDHWGSDTQGINTTRRFLLEWLSFTHRYVPIGVLQANDSDALPQVMQDRPPTFVPRGDLEGLLSSGNAQDWIKISAMFLGMLVCILLYICICALIVLCIMYHTIHRFDDNYYYTRGTKQYNTRVYAYYLYVLLLCLGPVSDDFQFEPKHKSSSYCNSTTTNSSGSGVEVVSAGVDDDMEANG